MTLKEFRINKAIAALGVCSRREADKLISSGDVSINGTTVDKPGVFVMVGDTVTISGKDYVFNLDDKKTRVWIYYKPPGIITTHRDEQGRKTVFEELKNKIPSRVISVGRLDINSEGLLLITNDSSFSKMAESPSTGWERKYKVRIFGSLSKDIIEQLEDGITIDGFRYAPMKILSTKKTDGKNSWVECSLTEGKNREIRKLFGHFDLKVNRLIRISYGPYVLGQMKPCDVKSVPVFS